MLQILQQRKFCKKIYNRVVNIFFFKAIKLRFRIHEISDDYFFVKHFQPGVLILGGGKRLKAFTQLLQIVKEIADLQAHNGLHCNALWACKIMN